MWSWNWTWTGIRSGIAVTRSGIVVSQTDEAGGYGDLDMLTLKAYSSHSYIKGYSWI